MNTSRKRACISLVLSLVMVVSMVMGSTMTASAATKATSIKSSSISVMVGQTKTISLSNKKSGATYSFTSNKKSVATVDATGVVTGKKAGTAKVTVKQMLKKKTTTVGTVTVTVKPLTLKGSYSMHVSGYQFAGLSDRAVITLNQKVDSIKASDLKVSETKFAMNYATFQMEWMTADRIVTDAYFTDATGKKISVPSKYIAVELMPTPACMSVYGTIPNLANFNTWDSTYRLNFALASKGAVKSNGIAVDSISIGAEYTAMTLSDDIEKFDTDTYKAADGVVYRYASYTPAEKSDTLFVWLHGMGEGGTEAEYTDPRMILLAADSWALASEEFQTKVGGANILVPQCPTWWMDPTGKGVELKGDTIYSYYATSLDEFIDAYAKKVGAKKIVIAGCSNGGYMTMVMALRNPTKYAAIIPICEALEYPGANKDNPKTQTEIDEFNSKLDAVKNLPMYFVYSKDDPLVVPAVYEEPTIEYLKKIGATNLHVSATENVTVTVGGVGPVPQFGHASWIYFFNNSTKDEGGVSAWDWLAAELKK